MKRLLIFFTCLFAKDVFCQNNPIKGSIKVNLKNTHSIAVDGTTLSLLRAKDSLLIKTTLADKNGSAEFENIKEGEYFISTTQIGFQKTSSGIFFLNKNNLNPQVSIDLVPASSNLKEVTVEARKPFIERKIDRLVVNVENSIVSAGSSAFEVLEKSPGIIIDQNDNISLKGRAGVIIMIDGKPSPLSGSDLSSFLRAQPSNAIEKIEIIANPSARFDASGNAGIINIVMKKDKRLGTNGNINIGAGQGIYFRTNSGINFNNRGKKFNVFGSYNYSLRKSLNDLTINRAFFTNGEKTGGLDLFNHMLYPSNTQSARLGVDYFVSKKTIIGLLFNGLLNDQDKTVDNKSANTDKNGQPISRFTTNSFTNDLLKHYGINFNLKHTIDAKGQEITFDLDQAAFNKTSTPSFITSYYDVNYNPTLAPYILDGHMLGKLNIYSAKSDYTKPFNNNSKIEAGFKTSFVKADNDLVFYDKSTSTPQYDAGRSNHFIYKENINAVYLSYNKEFKKINFQFGLRAEQANINAVQKVFSEKIDTSYIRIFPSAFLTYKIHKDHELGFSFSRRIQRPTYTQLNPFKSFIDLTSYNTGNPYLRPQFTNSFEASYTLKQKTTFSLSYARSTDVIAWIIKPVSTSSGLVSVETNDNISSSDSYSFDISDQHSLTKWWNAVTHVNVFFNKNFGVIENTVANNSNVVYNFNTTHNFTLPKKWVAEISVNYQSAQQVAYAFSKVQWNMNVGMQKTIFSGRSILRMNVTDIFRTQYPRVTSTFQNYAQYFTAFRDTRVFNVSLTYRFGKNTVQASRRRTSGVEEEKSRAN